MIVEVCVDSAESAQLAASAGADRLELNLALELDGLTPSAGLVQQVISSVEIPVIAMARPRSGNFVYSNHQWGTILSDIDFLVKNGAAGIAFGCLNEDRTIDETRCRQAMAIGHGKEMVFHRAFDETPNWETALETLIDLGVSRILTSGQAESAHIGISNLAAMQEKAAGRIEILPGAGVTAENAVEIIQKTGVTQIHGSFARSKSRGLYEEVQLVVKQLAHHAGGF
ncbi:MAG: copper homeostasis protein CutC [Planctomycetota bacterium]